jgi:ATP-binding cassette subfamily F protein uup
VPVIDAKAISKSYGTTPVLAAVDVTIRTGERVGVVGRNGAGKSTFAKILAGEEPADAGTVSRRRGARVCYLAQVPRFTGDPTAEEAVLAGLEAWSEAIARHEELRSQVAAQRGDVEPLVLEQIRAAEDVERLGGWEQRHRVTEMLGHLGILRTDARVSTLSFGEQRRVALAQILVARPDLAILDEPTNHLDAETIDWLEAFLIDEYQGAVLLISHDRYLLDRVATRTLEVADSNVHSYQGGYELYLEKKAEREALAARAEENRQNFLRTELEWLRRMPKARTTKQKARIERAEAAKVVQAPRQERAPRFELGLVRTGKTILETHALGVKVDDRELVRDLDIHVREGERIGIIGPNGAGKTTLLRTLIGERAPDSGAVEQGANTRVAYLDQRRCGLDDEATVFDSIVGEQPRIELGGRVIEPYAYLERFGFDRRMHRQRLASLSGGERARVALARMLRQNANLVVLDEPTNDLDVQTLGALESLLVEHGVTALVVTHDRWFLDRIATAVLAFEQGGAVTLYQGNFETYRRLRAEAARARSSEAPRGSEKKAETTRPDARSERSRKKKLTWAEERELAALPDDIERAEQTVSSLTEQLSAPGTYENGADVRPLTDALEAAKADVERLMQRWEELELKRSE